MEVCCCNCDCDDPCEVLCRGRGKCVDVKKPHPADVKFVFVDLEDDADASCCDENSCCAECPAVTATKPRCDGVTTGCTDFNCEVCSTAARKFADDMVHSLETLYDRLDRQIIIFDEVVSAYQNRERGVGNPYLMPLVSENVAKALLSEFAELRALVDSTIARLDPK